MKNKLLVMLSILIVILGVTIPTVAQGDWPAGCQLPDLEEIMSAATEAQAVGDVAAFVDSMSEMNQHANDALWWCLRSAVENEVDFAKVDLSGANLREADLSGANLQGAGLSGANLQGVNLSGANLQGATFQCPPCGIYYTNLLGANLEDANLQGADLRGANLQGTNLSGANLQEAYLASDTNLQGANLSGANLQGVWLSGAILRNANLTDAIFDETTTLPDGEISRDAGTWGICKSGCWMPDTDMGRFTDPEHPDFWDPCVELYYWPSPYCKADGE